MLKHPLRRAANDAPARNSRHLSLSRTQAIDPGKGLDDLFEIQCPRSDTFGSVHRERKRTKFLGHAVARVNSGHGDAGHAFYSHDPAQL
jgi:hypothetical protein